MVFGIDYFMVYCIVLGCFGFVLVWFVVMVFIMDFIIILCSSLS